MIESENSIYRPFFTVQFIHNGYQTPMENFFSQGIAITPDKDTQTILSDYKMGFRFFNDTLICFIRSKPFNPPATDPEIPAFTITGDIKIRFLMKTRNDFFGKTYVAAAGNKKVYQFSNKINNAGGGNLFLSAPVENHVVAKDYDGGTIVQDGGKLYTSLQFVKAVDSIVITNNDFWKPLEPLQQVVNNADLQDATIVNADDKCFGVIDMYNSGTTNSSYNLFDVSEKLFKPPPLFIIKFESKL
ncbi:MAG TPA: hypothetical protein VNS50_00780 [Ginsengibacter sp.]|nr:hypothetical protein [Ginsengibacter sp.]